MSELNYAAGKVTTGFSLPWVAKYNVNEGVVTYTDQMRLARGVEVSLDVEDAGDNDFYADNQLAETAGASFSNGTLNLTVDGLFMTAKRFIMGLPEANAEGWTSFGDQQVQPYIGVGFIARFMSNGNVIYTPYVIAKTSFNNVPINAATQEAEIDWQTTELTAKIMRGDDVNHNWMYEGKDYTSEAEAEEALKVMLGGTPSEGA